MGHTSTPEDASPLHVLGEVAEYLRESCSLVSRALACEVRLGLPVGLIPDSWQMASSQNHTHFVGYKDRSPEIARGTHTCWEPGPYSGSPGATMGPCPDTALQQEGGAAHVGGLAHSAGPLAGPCCFLDLSLLLEGQPEVELRALLSTGTAVCVGCLATKLARSG